MGASARAAEPTDGGGDMTHIYEILGWAGWIWAVLFFAFLTIKLRSRPIK